MKQRWYQILQQCTLKNAQSITSYEQRMVPAQTDDKGYGISPVSSNTPYQSIRQTVTQSNVNIRVMVIATPQIPKDAIQHTWTMSLKTKIKDFPSWLSYVHSSKKSQFALQFDGTDSQTSQKSPPYFILDFEGMVYYSHGPRRFLEQEKRIAKQIVYMHIQEDIELRGIQNHFKLQLTNNNMTVYENTQKTGTIIPSFTLEKNESYTFQCGGNQHNQNNGCIVGNSDLNSPIWGDENSKLVFNSGIIVLRSPIALYNGGIEINHDTTVIIDGSTNTSTVAIISLDKITRFINNGKLIIKNGILRLSGTSMFGTGTIDVLENSRLEIDPDQEVVFGSTNDSNDNNTVMGSLSTTTGARNELQIQQQTIIKSQGFVTFVSGITNLNGGIVILGTGQLTVGMAAEVHLNDVSTHILGGMYDGLSTLETSSGLNAFGSIIDGQLIIDNKSKVLVGSGIRIQGLGSLQLKPQSILQISIDFYDPIKYPDAAIIATGPGSERIYPGILCEGNISIKKGGIKASTGIVTKGDAKMDITDNGYIHIIGSDTINHFQGSYIMNNGDISIVSNAIVNFETSLQSSSTITVYSKESTQLFSGKTSSIITRNFIVKNDNITNNNNDVSNTFALYNPGTLLIKDSAKLRLMVPSSTTTTNLISPKFYSSIVQNSGSLLIDFNVHFEVNHYMQDYQVSTLLDPQKDVNIPHIAIFGSDSSIDVIPNTKYTISQTTGTILMNTTDINTIQNDEKPLSILSGYIGGTNGGSYNGIQQLGSNAILSPGSIFPNIRLPQRDNQPVLDDTTYTWRTISYQTLSSGQIQCKQLIMDDNSTISFDLTNAATANEGYDRLFVNQNAIIGKYVNQNITTVFESLAYQSSTMNTFSYTEYKKQSIPFLTLSSSLDSDTNSNNKKQFIRNRNLYTKQDTYTVKNHLGTIRPLTIVEQEYNGKPVQLQTNMNTFTQPGQELFRIPIITTNGQKSDTRFNKVTVNWIPTNNINSGRYTTTQSITTSSQEDIVDQQRYQTIYNRLQDHIQTLQYLVDTSSDTDKHHVETLSENNATVTGSMLNSNIKYTDPIHLAVEYTGNDIYLIGYSLGSGLSVYTYTLVPIFTVITALLFV